MAQRRWCRHRHVTGRCDACKSTIECLHITERLPQVNQANKEQRRLAD